MVEKRKRYRALVGMNLPDGNKSVRIKAGQLIPDHLMVLIPEAWYGVKVEEA